MNAFLQYFEAGGWLMYPLAACMFMIWLSYFLILFDLKDKLHTPDVCDLKLSASIDEDREILECDKELRGQPGIVPRLVLGCLKRMQRGLPFRDAFTQCRQLATGRYSYCFYVLGALVSAAPLMGLLGTVFGMIQTFEGVAPQSADAMSTFASGISQALITTQTGLVAALPGTFGLVHLYRLYRRLENTIDQCESHMALAFEHRTVAQAGWRHT